MPTESPAALLPDEAESLLRRAMEVCLQVVKRGEHAAHNAAVLNNAIERYLATPIQPAAPAASESRGDWFASFATPIGELLGCLPSSFSDGNEHILRKLRELVAASESRGGVPAREPTHDMIEAGARSIRCDLEVGHTPQHRTAQRAARNAWVTMRDVLAAAPTPPAVANGEPTAEQWMTAIRVWYYSQHHGMGCDPTAEWIAAYARSAAAKGEG